MKPKDRYLAVFSEEGRKKLERVPTFVQGIKNEFFTQNEEKMFENFEGDPLYNTQFDGPLVMGFDAVFAGVPHGASCEPVEVTFPDGSKAMVGISGKVTREGSSFYHGGAIHSMEIMDKLWANLKYRDVSNELIQTKKYYDEVAHKIYPVPMAGGIFDRVWQAMGMTEFSKNYRKKTKLYTEIVRFYGEILLHSVTDMVEAFKGSPGVIHYLDDVAFKGRTMVPPDRFVEEYGKYYIECSKIIKDAGLIPLLHTDGDITEMIPAFQKCGIMGVQGWEGGADPVYINNHFPDFVVIGFGDVGEVLPFGTPEQINQHVKSLMDALKANRHYIFGPSTVVVKEMPYENVSLFMKAAEKYGKY